MIKSQQNKISIHLPARGGIQGSLGALRQQNFNTPPRTGRNEEKFLKENYKFHFNTPPRTGRNKTLWKRVQLPLISIHLPARGGIRSGSFIGGKTWFQYTSPHGEEYNLQAATSREVNFNTPPRTGRNPASKTIYISNYISIHLPARGGIYWEYSFNGVDFNTPPRTGRNGEDNFYLSFSGISIHLPARGGINAYIDAEDIYSISIHLPARGGIQQLFLRWSK